MDPEECYPLGRRLERALWRMEALVNFPGGMDYRGRVNEFRQGLEEARSVMRELLRPPREVAPAPRGNEPPAYEARSMGSACGVTVRQRVRHGALAYAAVESSGPSARGT